MNVMNWIRENIAILKDILWILFTLIATVIAILTYKRARFTILQPLRTEVVKKQTELFIEIMTVFADDSKILIDLDLQNLVVLNTFKLLSDFGYVTKEGEKLKQAFDKYLVGCSVVKKGNQLDMFERPKIFEDLNKDIDNFNVGKKLYDNLKSGNIDIELIYFTKKYDDTVSLYTNLSKNPFLPHEIKKLLDKIIENINFDISVTLKHTLEDFMLSVYKKSVDGEKININSIGIYNEFNAKRINNSKIVNEIREKTRNYLMIDKKW